MRSAAAPVVVPEVPVGGVSGRHFWRPAGDGVRHAFRGPRWNGRPDATSVCGVEVSLPEEVSEEEWVRAPSCDSCNSALHAARNSTPRESRRDSEF
nr:zinc finger protein [Saccharopolyspora gloriosae]